MLQLTQDPTRLAVLIAALLVSPGPSSAQTVQGNVDRDGVAVPRFPVPTGSVSILNSGEGTVTVPLTVPPGVRAMAPRLSLQYSSGRRDRGLGPGWILKLGFPDAIRRVARFGVPSYDDGVDLFRFDGQDLAPVGGGSYRTTIDSFRRIRFSGDAWVVTEKDGTRSEYGKTDSDRSSTGLGVYAWHLSRRTDTTGNTILFTYGGPASGRLLESIAYTLNESGTPIGQKQEVMLDWEARPDVRQSATYGSLIDWGFRLESIETLSAGRSIRTYDLCYAGESCSSVAEPLRQISLLTSVSEVAADGTAIPSREFRYQERKPGWADDSAGDPKGYAMPVDFTRWRRDDFGRILVWDEGTRLIDINGDGLLDVIQSKPGVRVIFFNDGAGGWFQLNRNIPYQFVTENGLGNAVVDLGIRVLDVNGDGLPDMLKSVPGRHEVRLNNGVGWSAPGTYLIPEPAGETDAFSFVSVSGDESTDLGVRFGDVNGDGLPDLLKANGRFNEPPRVYVNNGANGWDPTSRWQLPDAIKFIDLEEAPPATGVRIVDVNADGLVDFVRSHDALFNGQGDRPREVWLNTGAGWELSSWHFPLPFFVDHSISGIGSVFFDYGIQVLDVNGDHYPDVVRSLTHEVGRNPCDGSPEPGGFDVWLNNHSDGFFKAEDWQFPVALVLSVCQSKSIWYYRDAGVRLADIDGDGLVDLLQSLNFFAGDPNVPGARFFVRTHLAEPAADDLLSEFTNPLGGTSSIEYARAHGPFGPPGQMPFTRVVASTLTERGNAGDPALITRFDFEGGHFDASTRQFRGFQHVNETRADQTVRERDFYVDEGRTGRLLTETLKDSDGSAYRERTLRYGAALSGGVYRTLLNSEETTTFDQDDESQSVSSTTFYTYDLYGNPRIVRERGYSGAIERTTYTPYTANTGAWIVGLPYRISVYEGSFAKLLSVEDIHYDGLGLRLVTRGLMTKRVLHDRRLEGLQLYTSEGGQSGSDPGLSQVVTTREYDAHGNVTLERNGRGFATRFDYQGNGFLFPHTTTWDNPGRPLVKQVTVFDRGLGVLREQTDPNGQTTRRAYDGLGRLLSITFPDDPPGDPGVRVSSYQLGRLPAYLEVQERIDNGRTRTSREYVDGLGRFKGRVRGAQSTWVLSEVTRYDNRGRRRFVHEPLFRANRGFTNVPSAPGTRLDYEDDKVSTITHPDGSKTLTVYAAGSIEHTDENGEVTTRRFDASGRVLEVSNAAGITEYSYDALGGLTRVVDPRGLVTEALHDARGLLRGLNAPDGTETRRNGYEVWNDYDAAGNHTFRWAGSDVWRVRYDALNRKMALHSSRDFDRSFKAEATLSYDNVATNGIGRLRAVIGYGPPATASVLTYDVRGRVTEEKFYYQFLDPALNGVSIAYTYDRDGRVRTIRDPRGGLIELGRNHFGQVDAAGALGAAIRYNQSWPDRISDIDYDAAGRVTAVTYGHGVRDVFSRDSRGRVSRLYGGPLFMNYQYDAAGNLIAETGTRGIIQYAYDPLHRIVEASGRIGATDVAKTYSYDASGNMLSALGAGAPEAKYSYTGGTNRFSSVWLGDLGTLRSSYDLHGNLTELSDGDASVFSRYTYDGLGRLRQWATEKASGAIVYNGWGRKVQRTRPGGGAEVYFRTLDGEVLARFEKTSTGSRWTTYLGANGARLALVDDAGQFKYIHSDRLGSARALTVDAPPPPRGCFDERGKQTTCPPTFTVLWQADYLPYGGEINATGGVGDNFSFTGQEMDPGMGAYDFGARYYDPRLRRFLQVDSFLGSPSDPRTTNRYSYALNNPSRFVDPTGNIACPIEFPFCANAVGGSTEQDDDDLPVIVFPPIIVEAPREVDDPLRVAGKGLLQAGTEFLVDRGAEATIGQTSGALSGQTSALLGFLFDVATGQDPEKAATNAAIEFVAGRVLGAPAGFVIEFGKAVSQMADRWAELQSSRAVHVNLNTSWAILRVLESGRVQIIAKSRDYKFDERTIKLLVKE